MITVSLKLTKISFTGFVLVLLFGSVHQAHSLFFQPNPPTWGQRIGWEAPSQTLFQQMGVVRTPRTLTQGLADTLITPQTFIATAGVFTTYQLMKVWRVYTALRDRYAEIRTLIKQNENLVNTLIEDKNASIDPTKRINFDQQLLASIKKLNPSQKGNIEQFLKKLKEDEFSFPWASYFIPAYLAESIKLLKADFDKIRTYIRQVDLAGIQKKISALNVHGVYGEVSSQPPAYQASASIYGQSTEQFISPDQFPNAQHKGQYTLQQPQQFPHSMSLPGQQAYPNQQLSPEQQFKQQQAKQYKKAFFKWIIEKRYEFPKNPEDLQTLFFKWIGEMSSESKSNNQTQLLGELFKQLQAEQAAQPQLGYQAAPQNYLQYTPDTSTAVSYPRRSPMTIEEEVTPAAQEPAANTPQSNQSWSGWAQQGAQNLLLRNYFNRP